MSGVRADVRLVELSLAQSREKARSLIMAGEVYLETARIDKPGTSVPEDCILTVKEQAIPFVSRGGLKLDKAVRKYELTLRGKVAMDIGASTGGFTDCMLQNDASKVYAIDVGYGQLAWKLRTDERVINLERTNFRYVTHEQIPEKLDFASVDVSFISLKHILPTLKSIIKPYGTAVCLIKPQFEAGKDKVGKKGVVREKSVHIEVIENVVGYIKENGFSLLALDFSPIKGPEGNIEYLAYIKSTDEYIDNNIDFSAIVEASHNTL